MGGTTETASLAEKMIELLDLMEKKEPTNLDDYSLQQQLCVAKDIISSLMAILKVQHGWTSQQIREVLTALSIHERRNKLGRYA